MKKLDKKQLPQFAALCVLSAGLFGYFVMRLITPSPASAGTRPAAPPKIAAPAGDAKPAAEKPAGDRKAEVVPVTTPAGTDTGTEAGAPPPTDGMHDPFVVRYVEPKTLPAPQSGPVSALPGKQIASLPGTAPALPLGIQSLPALSAASVPNLSSVPNLPSAPKQPSAPAVAAPPAPPTWSVTGVLQGDGGQVAILRSGEARRIVRAGDFADSVYKVVHVSRTEVVLRHGTAVYHLPIGAVKTALAKTAPVTPSVPLAAGASAPATMPHSVLPTPDGGSAAWQQMLLLNNSSTAP